MFGRDDTARSGERFLTAGVDIGTRTVKIALLAHGTDAPRVVAGEIVAVQGRRDLCDAQLAVRDSWSRVLRAAGVAAGEIALVASTGAKERTAAHVGHFYRRLSLTAGVRFLFPGATAVLDIGARQMRCALLGRAVGDKQYAVTRKDVTCGGEMLEAIARHSGVAVDVAGLSPAGVAAYDDLAARAAKLMGTLSFGGPTMVTGALALDLGFVRILARRLAEAQVFTALLVSPDAIFAGAYGAALLAARRYLWVLGSAARRETAPGRGLLRIERLILN